MLPPEHLRLARLNLITTLSASDSPQNVAISRLMTHDQSPGKCHLERLPSELRIQIFKQVLRHSVPLAPAWLDARINIAPLLLNKTLSRDALDAFYESNTIRIHHPAQLELQTAGGNDVLQLVRRLKLANGMNDRWWLRLNRDKFRAFLDRCRTLPKLKTVTIGCAGLEELDMSVRSWSAYLLGLEGNTLRCIDIGKFSLGGAYSHVRIEHLSLIQRWKKYKKVVQTCADNPQALSNHMRSALVHVPEGPLIKRMLEWTRVDLAFFVTAHKVCEALFNGLVAPPGPPARAQLMVRFYREFRSHLTACVVVGPAFRRYQGAKVTSIAGMCAGMDSELLEWATELLARYLKPGEDWRQRWEQRPKFPWGSGVSVGSVGRSEGFMPVKPLPQMVATVFPR